MAETITITLGADTLAFTSSRRRSVTDPVEPAVAVVETDGSRLYTYDLANDVRWHQIEFDRLIAAEAAFLDNFFANVCRGRLNEFTYTDEDAAAHTVNWWTPQKFACRYLAEGVYAAEAILFREAL